MAIKLENKTNTIAPNADYPYGDINDDSGSGDGTPISREVYADFHQFFAKLAAEAGINYNNLPDNATNGFQFWEAFNKFASVGDWIDVGVPVITTAGFTTITKIYNKIKIVGKIAHWKCSFEYILSSSTSFFEMNFPNIITATLGYTIDVSAPYNHGTAGVSDLIMISGDNGFGYPHLLITKQTGSFASTGGTASGISFDIVLELL